MKFPKIALLAAILLAAPVSMSFAAEGGHDGHHAAASSDQAHAGKGVVKWVDPASGEIDLRHEPMPSLKWPAMTMTFKAHDAAMLQGLKEGDKVDFDLMKMGDEFHITRIAPAK